MVDNQIGGIGIAPATKARVISQWRKKDGDWFATSNIADAIFDAILNMQFGDVLLLEAQENDPNGSSDYYPVEVADSTFDAIRVATALGITVVQAGANSKVDLDGYSNPDGKQIFNRGSGDFRDSGAIMVGASTSTVPHSRWQISESDTGSNFGSRMDLYAWGQNVDTTDTNDAGTTNRDYTPGFDGTSSASAIIAGAALIIQGIANSVFGWKLSPLQVRKILAQNGTPSNDLNNDKIGVMPDLKAIINGQYVNLTPDVYIRDYIGDDGNTTGGNVNSSPDIIVRQQPVDDPSIFGSSGGFADSSTLCDAVVAGREYSIYVRLLNRGGSSTTAVTTVYWSPPSTLVTPDLWTKIGDTPSTNVPTGRILGVSDRLAWPASAIPGTADYGFIAITGSPDDPEPLLPKTFPDFAKFVQNSNQAGWRNFNVVSAPPLNQPQMIHHFPFVIPGAYDMDRIFKIITIGNLPRGSTVFLKLPLNLSRLLGIRLREDQLREDFVLIPLHAFGLMDIGEGTLPAKSRANCELQIKVPIATYKQEGKFEFAIAQVWEGKEVGRLTYHFGPKADLTRGNSGHCGCERGCKHGCECGCHDDERHGGHGGHGRHDGDDGREC